MDFIKNLSTMGKNNKKIDELQDLNQLHKKDMNNILGGEKHKTKETKKDIFSWCTSILRQ